MAPSELELVKGLLNFGSFGLIVWLFVHTFTRTIPGFQDRLDRIVERFEETLERQHVEFRDLLAAERESRSHDIETLSTAITRRNLDDALERKEHG